jgi:glycosyltransferase involved in cell wall biosynthesis
MKVIHVPFCFYPDPIGGTEVYVDALAHHLHKRGVRVVIAAPGEGSAASVHDGLPVRRFAVTKNVGDLRDLYGEGDDLAAREFGYILDDEHTDVVHLHAFTRGASLRLVREAKRRGIPVVFTYHTPTVSCQRGTLMRWGEEVCDGALDLHTCARCTLHGLGLNKFLSATLGSLPSSIGRLVASAGLSGGFWTALRMTDLVRVRHAAFRALTAEVDHVIALCQWVEDLLLRNGAPSAKITVSPHGLCQDADFRWPITERGKDDPEFAIRNPQSPIRMAFLGRLDPTKGPDILIRALRLLPEAPLELHLYGIVQGASGTAYLQQLKTMASGDPRIAFCPPVTSNGIISLLRHYHLLAVPSRCLETGPLVMLEAFAAGVPVIGSELGGIAELVEHGVNGLLVEPDSPEAWCRTFRRLSEDRGLLGELQAGIRPPRGMQDVAEEMVALYAMLAKRRSRVSKLT